MKEIKLGGDGCKKGSRGHGGKGAFQRDLMHEVEWTRASADSGVYSRAHPHRPTLSVASIPTGTRVRFEAEPGVLVEGTVADQVGEDFTVEVEGGIRIPGMRQEQLSLDPARVQDDSATTSTFVFVNAPLPRAESVGAPLPRMEPSTNLPISKAQMKISDSEEPLVVPVTPVAMTWANQTTSKVTPRPPPSFQVLQAEDALQNSFEVVGRDPSPTSCHTTAVVPEESAQHQPNPRILCELQAMGFDAQLCAEAAFCVGNESVEKAAQWLVEALDQHAVARKTSAPTNRPPTQLQPQSGVSNPVNKCATVPNSIGFVDKLNAAYTNVRLADTEDEAQTETQDEWEVVTRVVQ